jgi:hypothetical protein
MNLSKFRFGRRPPSLPNLSPGTVWRYFIVMLVVPFLWGGHPIDIGWSEELPPSRETLKTRFFAHYSCPGNHGPATFSARLSSDQVTMIAQKMKKPAPQMTFTFRSPEDFAVVLPESSPFSEDSGNDLVGNFVQAVAQTAEGFFQTYLTVGYVNPFVDLPASAGIRIENERLIVEYPDQIPEHWVTLDFDPDFVLTKMETKDLIDDTRSIIRPIWGEPVPKRSLIGIHVEYFQGKYEQADFTTRMKIENEEVGGVMLPARVVVQARDGKEGNSPSAIFDFRFDHFILGSPPQSPRSPP